MTTIDNLMALADEYAGRSQLTEQGETLSREALRTALTEALAAQPVREPLTPEHIERIYHRYGGYMINCTRAIERAHGIWGEK